MPSLQIDAVERLMGALGKYQLRLAPTIFIVKFSVAFNQMAIIFFAPKTSFTCGNVKEKCPCSNPVYDTTLFPRTIITEWNLICDRKWLVSLSQSLLQFGIFSGSLLFGMAADSFGRRRPLLVAVALQLAAGLATVYASSYWIFTLLRFIVGLAVGGTMVITFVIIMEMVGAQYRDTISAVYHLFFNIGHMTLPIIAYYLRDYTHFGLALTIASVILLPYFCLIPESPRWLLAVRRTEDAVKLITRVAKVNKLPTENIRSEIETYMAIMDERAQSVLKKATVCDLFRTPNIRKHIIFMSINWLACSYCFYGMSQYVGHLHGDVFINVAASGTFCLIATLTAIPLMKFMSRKTIVISQNCLSVVCLLMLALTTSTLLSVILAVIGVMSSFIAFVVVYLYCGEMFPTVVRNAAIGFCSMMARVGSMIAPFVIDTSDVAEWLPPVLFAVFPFIGGLLVFLMPETKGCELMNTLDEAENFGQKSTRPAADRQSRNPIQSMFLKVWPGAANFMGRRRVTDE